MELVYILTNYELGRIPLMDVHMQVTFALNSD